MRKGLIATAVAVALFAVGAFAASFDVNSEDVASGSNAVDACADKVDIDFTTTFVNADNDWKATHAVVTFYDDAAEGAIALTNGCDGYRAEVVVEDENNVTIATGSLAVSGSSANVALSPEPLVGPIRRASVLVDGKVLFANDL